MSSASSAPPDAGGPNGAGPDPERRLVLRTIAAAVAVVVAGSFAVLATRDGGSDPAGVEGSPSDAIGPPRGTALATYQARREEVLDNASGRRAAVVSFTRYRTADEAAEVLDGVNVRGLLVAPPGGQPELVTGNLAQWAETTREELNEERAALVEMLDTDDPNFRAQFEADIRRIDDVLAGLDPDGLIVFGAVVDASSAALRALAETPPVRLVDVAAGTEIPDPERINGLRPEETVRAGTPPERPAGR